MAGIPSDNRNNGAAYKPWSAITKQIVIISGIVAGVWAVFRFSTIISPLAIALILAYILTPIVNWIHRHTRIPRTLTILLVYLILLVLAGLMPVLILPNLINQFSTLNIDLQNIINSIKVWVSQPIDLFGVSIEISNYYNQIATAIQNLISPFASGAVGVVFGIASSVVWTIFILVVSFYLVKDSAQIGRYLRNLVPPVYRREYIRLLAEIGAVWNSFFRGQIILGGVVGVTVAVVMSILGVRNALMLGVIAGILEVIPNFGPTIAAIPGILLAFFQNTNYLGVSNFWFAVIVAGAYILIQQLENNILVPRIIGASVKLHPVVVLVGAVAGALLGGVLGVLLAAPVLASLRILIRYAYRKIMDLNPFEDQVMPPARPAVPHAGVIAGRQIAAVLFDFDGTLVAADEELMNQWARRLSGIGPLISAREARRSLRRTIAASEKPAQILAALLNRAGLDAHAERVEGEMGHLRGQGPAQAFRLLDGVPELLDYLNGRFRLAIVTTRKREDIELFLNQFGYGGRFQAVVTPEDIDFLKPNPQPVLVAANILNVPVENCAVVGDMATDIQAARRAGAVAVGVLCGFGEREDFLDADVILDTTADLREWL